MGGTVNWRGVTLDQRTADMMEEVVRLEPDCPIWPSQGSYSGASASAGTHTGGGAIDLGAEDMSQDTRVRIETAMRCVGFFASIRDPSQSNWPWHIHGIAVQPGGKYDSGLLSDPAHDQVIDYYEGRNGLASNGPDKGARAYVGVTWEIYQQQQPVYVEEEEEMLVIRAVSSGAAFLLDGPRVLGIYDASDIEALEAAGVGVANLTDATFDSLKAR